MFCMVWYGKAWHGIVWSKIIYLEFDLDFLITFKLCWKLELGTIRYSHVARYHGACVWSSGTFWRRDRFSILIQRAVKHEFGVSQAILFIYVTYRTAYCMLYSYLLSSWAKHSWTRFHRRPSVPVLSRWTQTGECIRFYMPGSQWFRSSVSPPCNLHWGCWCCNVLQFARCL